MEKIKNRSARKERVKKRDIENGDVKNLDHQQRRNKRIICTKKIVFRQRCQTYTLSERDDTLLLFWFSFSIDMNTVETLLYILHGNQQLSNDKNNFSRTEYTIHACYGIRSIRGKKSFMARFFIGRSAGNSIILQRKYHFGWNLKNGENLDN